MVLWPWDGPEGAEILLPLESGLREQRAGSLGTVLQDEAVSQGVTEMEIQLSDWNGLVSPGKKEKNPSRILTMGKHFCNKERASPYKKASNRKDLRMVVFGV